MNWKTSALWALLAICSIGAWAGCNKPSEGGKKPSQGGQAPANTTDSK